MQPVTGSTFEFWKEGVQSLVLRRVCLESIIDIISTLESSNITSLFFDESIYHSRKPFNLEGISLPLLPSLRKVKYGAKHPLGDYDNDTAPLFSEVFLKGAKITHFEMSYGFKPCLAEERTAQGTRSEVTDFGNWIYDSTRQVILHALREHSSDSLEVYIEDDELSGPFPSPKGLFANEFHYVLLSGWNFLYLDAQLCILSPHSMGQTILRSDGISILSLSKITNGTTRCGSTSQCFTPFSRTVTAYWLRLVLVEILCPTRVGGSSPPKGFYLQFPTMVGIQRFFDISLLETV